MSSKVLCLLTDGFEEIEAVTPIDLLRRAGVEVMVAGLSSLEVTGRSGIRVTADALLSDVVTDAFDLLFLPGGPGVAGLRADGRPAALARIFQESGKKVAAICAAPLVLKDAGVLGGKRFTVHVSALKELPEAIEGEAVVIDEPLITSRGAGTALPFGLALVEALCGAETAAEIAVSIHA